MSNEINDGGPAFPFEVTGRLMPDGGWLQTYESGMSLRDYFASQALRMIISDPDFRGHIQSQGDFVTAIARQSYRYADALIAARNA